MMKPYAEDLQLPDIEGQEGRRKCLWHSCPALAGPAGNDATGTRDCSADSGGLCLPPQFNAHSVPSNAERVQWIGKMTSTTCLVPGEKMPICTTLTKHEVGTST